MLVRVEYVAFETKAERKLFAVAIEGEYSDSTDAAEIAYAQLQHVIDNPLSNERMKAIAVTLGVKGIRSASVGDIFYVSEFRMADMSFSKSKVFVCYNGGFIEIDLPTLNKYLKLDYRDMMMGWDWCKERLK